MKPYEQENVPHARELRNNMTPWERKLWYLFLRNYPYHFQRQKPIGPFIADFYCAKARLVLELDGSGHFREKQETYDRHRTELLNEMGLNVLRINNIDIDRRFQSVCEMIDAAVKRSLPKSRKSVPAPSSEGAKS